ALLFRENESLRLVVAVRAHAARLVDLLAQALTGLAKQSFDLRTERLDVGSGRSLAGGPGVALLRVGRNDAAQLGRPVGEDALQLGRIDVPLALLILGGGDLATFDRPENRPLVETGCGGSCCKGVRHTLTHWCWLKEL